MSPFAEAAARTFGQFSQQVSQIETTPLLGTGSPRKIRQACHLLWDRRGKRLRPHLVFWFGDWFGVSSTVLTPYAWAAEALHTATLLHDDVIDASPKRRGGPSANALFDNTVPVLAGDYLLSEAVSRVVQAGNPQLALSFCETLRSLTEGELLQYELRHRIPTWGQIQEVADKKTASLFCWAASVGPTLARSPRRGAVLSFVTSLGRLFQFGDDLLDLCGTAEKGSGLDLMAGQVNGACWHLLESHPSFRQAVSRFFEGEDDGTRVASLAQSFVHRTPALLTQLETYRYEAHQNLGELPDRGVRTGLESLVETLFGRYELVLRQGPPGETGSPSSQ